MDTCPKFETFMKPMLMLASKGEVNVRESADVIANDLGLTSQAKLEFAGNGNQRRYVNRTHWAATYLRQAGLLKTSRRGYVEITKEGIEFNNLHKNSISKADLGNISAYIEFQGRRGSRKGITNQINDNVEDSLTPDDRIDDALSEIETELAGALLEQLQNSSPSFFEKVVLDLFLKMGYGGSDEQNGEVLGKSGDDGVADSSDAFPLDSTESVDTDNDGIGNNADSDDDGDGVADSIDPNPLTTDTLDTDGDGTLDIVDTDDDGDGVPDSSDAFPLDSNESVDSDGDGTGDNADTLDNSRLYTDSSTYDDNNFNSSTWNDIASQLGTGTAVFSITNQTASVTSGSGCPGCTAVVDTSISIDFSAMNYQFNSEVDFTKPGYEVVTMTDQSGTIPLGQSELTTGSLYSGSSSSTINDLQSTRQLDQEYTFTSTSDSSVTISKELDVAYYYHADLSDPSDMDSTDLGVNGYTKIVYGNNSSEFTQLNTSRAALEPQ